MRQPILTTEPIRNASRGRRETELPGGKILRAAAVAQVNDSIQYLNVKSWISDATAWRGWNLRELQSVGVTGGRATHRRRGVHHYCGRAEGRARTAIRTSASLVAVACR